MTDVAPGSPAAAPLVISSPVVRSGTTLLQRLLCSSAQGRIYGDSCGRDIAFLLNLAESKTRMLHLNRQRFTNTNHAVQEGAALHEWIADLMPDTDTYAKAYAQSLYSLLECMRADALRHGRTVWGFKVPGWLPETISQFRAYCPEARLLYVYRHIDDCVRSAAAMRMLSLPQDLPRFCRDWMRNLDFMLGLARNDARILALPFEKLTARPEEFLPRIAAFCDLPDLKPAVFAHKVNAWAGGTGPATEGERYVAPEELTEEHRLIIAAETGPFAERLYPERAG